MEKYNYYGNYNNDNDNEISVFEIHKKQREKEIRKLKLYRKIINKCFDKIRLGVDREQLFCFFQLPEYILGFPLFNMTDCLFFILAELDKKGFLCKYCGKLQIYITWPQKKKNLQLENKPKLSISNNENLKKFEKEISLNFKSIDNYVPRKINKSNIDINNTFDVIKNKFNNIPINEKNINVSGRKKRLFF
tara:strand:- start:144 stop:716 length:573 start_codon:yes stop_codon:yes gene_type:complete